MYEPTHVCAQHICAHVHTCAHTYAQAQTYAYLYNLARLDVVWFCLSSDGQ